MNVAIVVQRSRAAIWPLSNIDLASVARACAVIFNLLYPWDTLIMKNSVLAATIVTMGLFATPASAAVLLCDGANCPAVDTNVYLNATTAQATVSGTVGQNSGVGITFSSLTDVLNGDANGQAGISSTDGVLNSLSFLLQDGYSFGSATFNLVPVSGRSEAKADLVRITYYTPDAGWQTIGINTNGQNFTGIYGTAGERFIGAGFEGAPITDGIGNFRQLRLGDVRSNASVLEQSGAVPEASTWAMLLIGFGAVGATLRTRKTNRGPRLRVA